MQQSRARDAGPSAPGLARRPRFPAFFWILVALSIATIGAGTWWLVAQRAAASDNLSSQVAEAGPTADGKMSPAVDFELADLSGHPVRLSDLRGKVVLLNFWATWCPPCKAEMPDLEALYGEYGSQKDLVVLAVNVEESQEAAQAFAQQYKLTFPVLPDPQGQVSNQQYFIRSLPTSFIIDREGNVRYRWTGQQTKGTMVNNLEKVW